jgi:hypothetical protein
MGRIKVLVYLFLFGAIAGWVPPVQALGAELYIPAIHGKPGKSLAVPVMIDHVDNLAGIKIVLKYDAKILAFTRGSRTKHTDELMHVVNDRNPGVLIIVMAGAKGIKGTNIPLFILNFRVLETISGVLTTAMEIPEVELMSDKLKVIECSVRTDSVVIGP